jgi:hypothetical protein
VGPCGDGPAGHPEELRADPRIRLDGEQLVMLAVSKDQVKDAPDIDENAHISESEQDVLRQYYRGHLGTAG